MSSDFFDFDRDPWAGDDTPLAGCLVFLGFVLLLVVFLVRGVLPEKAAPESTGVPENPVMNSN